VHKVLRGLPPDPRLLARTLMVYLLGLLAVFLGHSPTRPL
jgi:hypothetical protein